FTHRRCAYAQPRRDFTLTDPLSGHKQATLNLPSELRCDRLTDGDADKPGCRGWRSVCHVNRRVEGGPRVAVQKERAAPRAVDTTLHETGPVERNHLDPRRLELFRRLYSLWVHHCYARLEQRQIRRGPFLLRLGNLD